MKVFKALAALIAAAALVACGGQARSFTPLDGDAFLGPADAPVVLVEYGAPTCPACKFWHDQNWSDLKTTFIDTNRIKFVFRPLPSHNPPVDAAIASLARCMGAENYFAVLDEAFARHQQIEDAAHSGSAREALVSLAGKFGMTPEQTEACISDPANVERISRVRTQAEADKVQGTPTFMLNGRELSDIRFPAMARAIEAALAEQSPAAAPTPQN